MRNTYQSQQLRKMRLRACIRLWNLPLSYLGYEWGWKRVSDMRLDLAILLSEKFLFSNSWTYKKNLRSRIKLLRNYRVDIELHLSRASNLQDCTPSLQESFRLFLFLGCVPQLWES